MRDPAPTPWLRVGSLLTLVAMMSVGGCGDEDPAAPRSVVSVEITPATVPILREIGDTVRLTAVPLDADGEPVPGMEISWTSVDPDVAAVDPEGLVTAVGIGATDIRAETGGVTGTREVRVESAPAPVGSVVLSPAVVPVLEEVGDTIRLAATPTDPDGAPLEGLDVSWTSDDPDVVAVDDEGLVTATGIGATDVRATVNNVSEAARLRVGSFELTIQAPDAVTAGSVAQLRAFLEGPTAAPDEVTDEVAWSVTGQGFVDESGRFVGYLTPDPVTVTADGAPLGEGAASAEVEVALRGVRGSLTVLGTGVLGAGRPTTDLWVHGEAAYSGTLAGTTCSSEGPRVDSDLLAVWNVADPAAPTLVDSVKVDALQVNDVKVAEDGSFAVLTHEGSGEDHGGVTILNLSDPLHPDVVIRRHRGLEHGVHNVWVERLQGTFYLFAAAHERGLVVFDLTNPGSPVEVADFFLGSQVHDVYVRDGLAFVSHWDEGLVILDVGNGIRGGSPESPVQVSRVEIPHGNVHNAWYWPESGYVFVGQENFGRGGEPLGKLWVLDASDLGDPRIVATSEMTESPPHNFWMDEGRGILFAAWYTDGLVALDVTGTLLGELDRQDRTYAVATPSGPECSTSFWSPQLVESDLIWASEISHGIWSFRFQVESGPP